MTAETEEESYKRRMKAAGMSRDDPVPEDIDEMRDSIGRRIAMGVNKWHGCPERLCRRHRGCMAPHSTCSNQRETPPMSEEEWNLIVRALRKTCNRLEISTPPA